MLGDAKKKSKVIHRHCEEARRSNPLNSSSIYDNRLLHFVRNDGTILQIASLRCQ